MGEVFRRNAAPRVGDGDQQLRGWLTSLLNADCQPHFFPFRSKLQGIGQQVVDDLFQAVAVYPEVRVFRQFGKKGIIDRFEGRSRMIGAEQLPTEGDKRGWLFFQAGFLGFQARQFEQFFHQPGQLSAVFQNQFEAAPDAIVQGRPVLADEVFQWRRDQGDGRPEFVGDIGKEAGLHFVQLLKFTGLLFDQGLVFPDLPGALCHLQFKPPGLQLFVAGPDQAKGQEGQAGQQVEPGLFVKKIAGMNVNR